MEKIKMSKLILYHGSPEIIQTPVFGKGKSYNDYGRGFYCTEHLELAKEWACTENTDGYANKYEIDNKEYLTEIKKDNISEQKTVSPEKPEYVDFSKGVKIKSIEWSPLE